jgi:2-polyprenyl-3-methyl-5-hydroxy-6-metoxy-1,4-benzoquinol methylase
LTRPPQDSGGEEEGVAVNTYGNFAHIYDGFGSEDFCLTLTSHILERLEKYSIPEKVEILDIACGTGVVTVELAKRGYVMTGVDLSPDMLSHARDRAREHGVKIRLVRDDMRTFKTQQQFPCVISTHDVLDHLFEDEELDQAFQRIASTLLPGGLFIFDMNAWEGIRHLNQRTIFVENAERSGAYHLIAEEGTLETNIVGFLRVEDNLYERFAETLFQRCYSNEEIEKRLELTGLELLERVPIQYLQGDVFKQLWVTRMPGLEVPELY